MSCLSMLFGGSALNTVALNVALRGKTPNQKAVIKYFIATGCIQSLFGMKDAGFDEALAEKRRSFDTRRMALNKIGLDEDELKEIPDVSFEGFQEHEYSKVGKDMKWRSAKYAVTHLFFSATQVYMYQLTFDMSSNDQKERTEEYFYKDITNFSTTSENIETIVPGCLSVKKQAVNIQRFALIVPGDRFTCDTQQDIERSVQGMKAKLREKKNS